MNITGGFATVFDKNAGPSSAFYLSNAINGTIGYISGSSFDTKWIHFDASKGWTGEKE